jgi:hypothetical protein
MGAHAGQAVVDLRRAAPDQRVCYAHPYAWDEIGFGGPAYPRGYGALNFGAGDM